MTTISNALLELRPDATWSLNGETYEGLNWTDTEQTKPTKQEVENKVAELIADFESKQYQRDRVYPSLGDQLDMLWHAIDNGTLNKTSDFYTAIKAVKDAHPKSE
jgi:hypothetical protein